MVRLKRASFILSPLRGWLFSSMSITAAIIRIPLRGFEITTANHAEKYPLYFQHFKIRISPSPFLFQVCFLKVNLLKLKFYMDITSIRQELHNYLEVAKDKKVKAIYTMVEDDIKESAVEYSEEFKAELNRRVEHYLNGGKMVTPVQMRKRLKAILKKRK
jgi:hypothetical protein